MTGAEEGECIGVGGEGEGDVSENDCVCVCVLCLLRVAVTGCKRACVRSGCEIQCKAKELDGTRNRKPNCTLHTRSTPPSGATIRCRAAIRTCRSVHVRSTTHPPCGVLHTNTQPRTNEHATLSQAPRWRSAASRRACAEQEDVYAAIIYIAYAPICCLRIKVGKFRRRHGTHLLPLLLLHFFWFRCLFWSIELFAVHTTRYIRLPLVLCHLPFPFLLLFVHSESVPKIRGFPNTIVQRCNNVQCIQGKRARFKCDRLNTAHGTQLSLVRKKVGACTGRCIPFSGFRLDCTLAPTSLWLPHRIGIWWRATKYQRDHNRTKRR